MKNLLVTGGCGFIGSNFIRYWLDNTSHCRVVNLDALTYAGNLENLRNVENNPDYRFVHGNILDDALVSDLLFSNDIDAVVNFAAESHVDRSIVGPEVFVDTNVKGTFVLLEASRKYWEEKGRSEAFRFLHVSTDEVYGSLGPEGYFTETTPYAPSSPYSASKAASDHFVRAYHRTFGLPSMITNCSNNYGPFQFPEKLIPMMVTNILEQKPLPVYGDGKNIRDWLYVLDHCDALKRVLESGRPGETYNIGGNAEVENIEIVRLLCEIMDRKLQRTRKEGSQRLIRFVQDRPGHDRRYAIDASKIKKELEWAPRYRFEDALEETVDWYLDNPGWVANVKSGEYKRWIETQYKMK